MNAYFHLERDPDDIAWLHFDTPQATTNVLTLEALEYFDQALIGVAQSHPKGLAIVSDKPSGFIAGADVKSFAQVRTAGEAQRLIERVHEIFHRLESLAFPSLALIHGYCLGGGLELALACRYRIAREDPSTRLGLPEVRLGIFPGFGGTVRSIHRLGHLNAMELMLSGRSLSARAARRIGLVDLAVPERQLRTAARQLLLEQPISQAPHWTQRLAGWGPVRPLVAGTLRRKVARVAPREHFPAPYSLIDHWQRYAGQTTKMYRSEAARVGDLIVGDTAQNLVRTFLLQERLKSEGDKQAFQPEHIHVVGGGVMGGDIAAWCALQGLRVTLQDREPKCLTKAMQRAHQLFQRKLQNRYLVQAAMDRLTPDHRGYGVSGADVVIEAIFEEVAAKQALYATLEPQMKHKAVLATNTSSIPLEVLSERLARPQRLVGLHFFNPVAKMQLIEIVGHADTEPRMLERAAAFARHIDKLPLPVKSSPGFLVNRVLLPYLMEAVELLGEGISPTLVDRAAERFGMPMGPIELADTVGLDICLAVAEKLSSALDNPVPARLRELVVTERLGRKSGEGFYRWRNGKPQKPKVATGHQAPKDLTDRLILRLINEAVACLREGVVADEDLLDAGVIFGTGFAPFRGGPMRYVHGRGENEVQHRLEQLERQHGRHFQADDGWVTVR